MLGTNIKLDTIEENHLFVKATMYTVSRKQTDASPLITASGFKLDPKNPKKHKIIAISRDLKDSLQFGTKVRLENAGKYNGIYFVEDLMNKRFERRIDILVNPRDKPFALDSVKLVILK